MIINNGPISSDTEEEDYLGPSESNLLFLVYFDGSSSHVHPDGVVSRSAILLKKPEDLTDLELGLKYNDRAVHLTETAVCSVQDLDVVRVKMNVSIGVY